jgi:hypothetical protein
MSTSEPNKDEARASETTAASSEPESQPEKTAAQPDDSGDARAVEEKARVGEPVWPPPESQPVSPEGEKDEGGKPEVAEPALLTKTEGPKPPEATAREGKSSQGKSGEGKSAERKSAEHKSGEGQSPDAPATDAAAKSPEQAAEPGQEMTLSESTLHWLVDGEVPVEPTGPNPALAPIYDSRAPVAGRKRTVAVIGGAAVLALGVALVLHAKAAHHEKAPAVAPSVGSADLLIYRAEAARAQGRWAEALDLARLATATDPHYADAYVFMGGIQRSNGQAIEARDSYRRYLDLAPLGNHAAEARAALKTLPP